MTGTYGVPVVDMKAGGPEFAQRFGNGLEKVGFVVIVNHGIEARLLKRVYEIARQVFALPADIKKKIRNARNRPTGWLHAVSDGTRQGQ